MSKTLFDVLKECKLNDEREDIKKFNEQLKNSKWEVQYNEKKI